MSAFGAEPDGATGFVRKGCRGKLIILQLAGGALLAAGAPSLLLTIRSLVRSYDRAEVARFPLAPALPIELPDGEQFLCLEGPRRRACGAPFRFDVSNPWTGGMLPMGTAIGGTGRRGRARSRVTVGRLVVPAAGPWMLRVTGLVPCQSYAEWSVVFVRPFLASLVLHVLAATLAGGAVIGGLVLTILGVALP